MARVLDVSKRTVYRMIAGAELPQPVKVRSGSRIPESEVRAYIERLKRGRTMKQDHFVKVKRRKNGVVQVNPVIHWQYQLDSDPSRDESPCVRQTCGLQRSGVLSFVENWSVKRRGSWHRVHNAKRHS